MSFNAESTAIEKRLLDNWTQTPVELPNMPFERPENAPWIAMDIIRAAGRQISLGENSKARHSGIIQISIYVPEDSGDGPACGLADLVAPIFDRKQFSDGAGGSITCRVPSLASYAPRAAGRHCRIIEIPFQHTK